MRTALFGLCAITVGCAADAEDPDGVGGGDQSDAAGDILQECEKRFATALSAPKLDEIRTKSLADLVAAGTLAQRDVDRATARAAQLAEIRSCSPEAADYMLRLAAKAPGTTADQIDAHVSGVIARDLLLGDYFLDASMAMVSCIGDAETALFQGSFKPPAGVGEALTKLGTTMNGACTALVGKSNDEQRAARACLDNSATVDSVGCILALDRLTVALGQTFLGLVIDPSVVIVPPETLEGLPALLPPQFAKWGKAAQVLCKLHQPATSGQSQCAAGAGSVERKAVEPMRARTLFPPHVYQALQVIP
jgi:hypothetical protein